MRKHNEEKNWKRTLESVDREISGCWNPVCLQMQKEEATGNFWSLED
jgi:hypothetical protein